MNEPVALFKCLADGTRYRILCHLYCSDSYVELLASQLDLTPGTVSFHLKKMEAEGLVRSSRQQFYIIYSLERSLFDKKLSEFLIMEEKEPEEEYRKKVCNSFFKGGKLLRIPVQQKKREIVLAEIMKEFEREEYPEKEVNEIIMRHFDDFCTLRRTLISDGFMTRDHEIYTVVKRR